MDSCHKYTASCFIPDLRCYSVCNLKWIIAATYLTKLFVQTATYLFNILILMFCIINSLSNLNTEK